VQLGQTVVCGAGAARMVVVRREVRRERILGREKCILMVIVVESLERPRAVGVFEGSICFSVCLSWMMMVRGALKTGEGILILFLFVFNPK